jgi:hypothetical protein
MRTNMYVDAFNLFYGRLKGSPYKWLDLDALARRLLPEHEIHRIRYFTARVVAWPDNPDNPPAKTSISEPSRRSRTSPSTLAG